jgi:hypothetical protein
MSRKSARNSYQQTTMTTAQSSLPRPGHHMVFTMPRTASHLLLKLLNLPNQLSIHRHPNNLDGYVFLPAAAPRFRQSLPGKPIQEWTEEAKTALKDVMQSSFEDWERLIDEAEKQGKGTFVKEHLHWMISPVAEARLYGHQKYDSSTATQFQVHRKMHHSNDAREEDNVTYFCFNASNLLSSSAIPLSLFRAIYVQPSTTKASQLFSRMK